MKEIIADLKRLNNELPEDYNSPAYYDHAFSNLFAAVESCKGILLKNTTTENYTRFKVTLNDIIHEAELMNSDFEGYSVESKIEVIHSICTVYELLNAILENHYVKLGLLNQYWKYDYNNQDIYRVLRHQLVINPEDGSLLPILSTSNYTD